MSNHSPLSVCPQPFTNAQAIANCSQTTTKPPSFSEHVAQQFALLDAQQAAKREAREQLTKSFILTDTCPETGITRTYRITQELISTEQAATIPELQQLEALTDDDVDNYAN